MPFDLRVSRKGGEIRREELHRLFASAPASQKGEDLYWVTRQGEPWFAAEWDGGEIVLSASQSHHRYLRQLRSFHDMALRIAGQLDADVFDDAEGDEVDAGTLDERLAPTSLHMKRQGEAFRRAQERLSAHGEAPLEYPLAGVDLVPEYLLFYVVGGKRDAVVDGGPAVEVVAAAPRAWLLQEGEGGAWLTRVLQRDDGSWQIWPAWGQSSFARIAEVTLATAERLMAATGGELRFLAEPCSAPLRSEIRQQARGLGVEFYEWAEDR